MKIRSVIQSWVGIVAYVGLAQAVNAQTQYTVTHIGDPKASYTSLDGINNNGEVTGTSDWRPFVWRNGESIDLSDALGDRVDIAGINDLGQITGSNDGPTSGFLYTDGVVTELGAVKNSYWSDPDGLNNLGEVVFVALIFPPDTTDVYHWSYIYRNGTCEQIPTLGGTYSRAYAINDSGMAAGDASTKNDSQTHAIVYNHGQTFDLGTLGGANSTAYDLNEAGYVTGYAAIAGSSDRHAFLSSPISAPGRHMIDLGVLPGKGRNSYGEAINSLNQVVGASEIDAVTHEQNAFIYTDGAMWDLNKLIHRGDPANGHVRFYAAHGINDDGWIIVSGEDDRFPDVNGGYLLRPVAK